jgi:hypothetical protein
LHYATFASSASGIVSSAVDDSIVAAGTGTGLVFKNGRSAYNPPAQNPGLKGMIMQKKQRQYKIGTECKIEGPTKRSRRVIFKGRLRIGKRKYLIFAPFRRDKRRESSSA